MVLLPPGDLYSPESILAQIPSTASPSSPHFLIFFASPDDSGKPWCPDCSDVQSQVDRFIPTGVSSTLVHVGDRAQWKESKFRQAPFNVTRIPTIIRVEQGGDSVSSSLESAPRLVESDLRSEDKFKQFVATK
ncbi:hypothetical protein JCM3775_000174 [Rhodotorula graminis]|uniref:Thioredoxin domain-containing protein n=1 Tax=Rhodotorula graminis (strain WP1) TaxID=578459 RepID=A0A194S712_RHOGW|nr:uncharacterized protein RHOBADRAFT_64729 [Rhodotorula graminis WP1]KPV76334.1 hypothetical protein RHOBADRAFT_64729 [Rhodotorula graminis WP1]